VPVPNFAPGNNLTSVALNAALNYLDTEVVAAQTAATAAQADIDATQAGTTGFAGLKLNKASSTISGGALTPTAPFVVVDGEAAASDDLTTLNSPADGDIQIIRPANAARIITVKDGTGNILAANQADYVLDATHQTGMYVYDSTLGRWLEIGRPVGMEKIITFTQLGSTASSIVLSFTGIYRHLVLVAGLRTDRAAVNDDVLVRFNADAAAANYASTGAAFSTGAAYQEVLTTVAAGNVVYFGAAAASAPANSFASFTLTVENALSTTLIRHMYYNGFVRGGTATTNSGHFAGGGWWNNTSAVISSITLLPRLGTNFAIGSHYTLYGMM